jgi:glycosyltransferase involved in cell wall biosynthesis
MWFVSPAIKCKPDLIHANDADTLRIAVTVKEYWAKRKHDVAVVYDAHEYTAGVHRPNPTWKPAMLNQETNYINRVDAVVTVSDEIADLLLEEYKLTKPPTVVLNAPLLSNSGAKLEIDSLRKSLALANDVPLFVYVGISAHARGIHTVVESLQHFPEAHLAVLTRTNSYVKSYIELARDIGVGDRLHVQGYVPQHQVSPFIADATAGVNPVLHHPNHEMSCFTKFYEYLHAHLPIVTSDVRTMAKETKERGIGTVFIAEDSLDCARAMKELCKDINTYRAAITDELISEWSWEVQANKLNALYSQLTTEAN